MSRLFQHVTSHPELFTFSLCMEARWYRDFELTACYRLLLNHIYFYFTLINSSKIHYFVFIEVLYIIKESIYELREKQDLEGFLMKIRGLCTGCVLGVPLHFWGLSSGIP